jgi:hypothetical protein
MVDGKDRLCPSGRCEPGSLLIGVIGSSGTVGYLTPALPGDDQFVQAAHRGRSPERRFRFAQTCAESGCDHWAGGRCGVVDLVASMAEAGEIEAESGRLPACAIRPHCRWFSQRGAAACRICPLVITDITAEQPDNAGPQQDSVDVALAAAEGAIV